MDISEKLKYFDPSGVGNTSNNIFGLPFEVSESKLVFIPVPWDVTVTNHAGTSKGPMSIFQNSFQIDLYDPLVPNAWKEGIAMEAIDPVTASRNTEVRKKSERVIRYLESGADLEDNQQIMHLTEHVNQTCDSLMLEIEKKCLQYIENGQIPFIVGGDHSVSLGLIRALALQESFGILQIDAHADMRVAYQGFEHSHASIMHHALNTEGVSQIVQVGIRELCNEEIQTISMNHKTVKTFFDHDLHQRMYEGEVWGEICHDIIDKLPDNIYVTFDVDGLEPACCPGTGTPVPGGLSYNHVMHLLGTAFNAGKRFIGADLVETGPTKLDGIISSRILYRLAGMMIKSNE